MAIYLDDTQNEHELLENAVEASNMPAWIKKSLINRIKSDIQEKKDRKSCEHEFGEYIGHKTCCMKCGGFDIGMGVIWERKA